MNGPLVPVDNDQCTTPDSKIQIDPIIQICAGGEKGNY